MERVAGLARARKRRDADLEAASGSPSSASDRPLRLPRTSARFALAHRSFARLEAKAASGSVPRADLAADLADLQVALGRLSVAERELLALRFAVGLASAEIAEHLGLCRKERAPAFIVYSNVSVRS